MTGPSLDHKTLENDRYGQVHSPAKAEANGCISERDDEFNGQKTAQKQAEKQQRNGRQDISSTISNALDIASCKIVAAIYVSLIVHFVALHSDQVNTFNNLRLLHPF